MLSNRSVFVRSRLINTIAAAVVFLLCCMSEFVYLFTYVIPSDYGLMVSLSQQRNTFMILFIFYQ